MSFLDLATLASHRRTEMEARISTLTEKCDQAHNRIQFLKIQAQGLVHKLNCDPSELKDTFLNCMKQLDEFIYLVTDFNLSVWKMEETATAPPESFPVHDIHPAPPPPPPPHLLDVLSEPARPAPAPARPPARRRASRPPKEHMLIEFSSGSCSQESVGRRKEEVPLEEMKMLTVKAEPVLLEKLTLPAQELLLCDKVYTGCIMHVDGQALWVITDDISEASSLMTEMTEYYLRDGTHMQLSRSDVESLIFLAYYDEESNSSYRCLFLEFHMDSDIAQLFLVDTGETRYAHVGVLKPLARQFCAKPPFARCCHLAGVEPIESRSNDLELFLKSYVGQKCRIEVDDNTSESVGVYICLESREYLNQIVLQKELAVMLDAPPSPPEPRGPPELLAGSSELELSDCPEHDDPVEAVTGYHNRDEVEICKHYKGGPDKTCFKGPRCKLRHVLKHPDGWTLDRIEVTAKGRPLPLPAPGSVVRVRVTCVSHFNYVYLQLVEEPKEEPKRRFGVILPPTSLSALVSDMNCPASRAAHQRLKVAPAPGEMVAALYPPDGLWYRALVLEHITTHDQSVEVRYVDYGNEMFVKENNIRALDLAYMTLPVQAVRCKLAGVVAASADPEQWQKAKLALQTLVQDREMTIVVVARHYDELDIELYDSDEYSVAEKLDASNMIKLVEYTVQEERDGERRVVVP